MRPLSKDVTECPNGYRRYVYRINVSVPFEDQFRQEEHAPRRPEMDTEQKPESRFAIRWSLSTLMMVASTHVASGMSLTGRGVVVSIAIAIALGVVNARLLSLRKIRLPKRDLKRRRSSMTRVSSYDKLGQVEHAPGQPQADIETVTVASLIRSRAPRLLVLLVLINGPPMWVIPAPENELALASWGAGPFLPRILGMLIAVIANMVLWILVRNDDKSN